MTSGIRIWGDGKEDEEGQALVLLSVLYLAARGLDDCIVELINVDNLSVTTSAQAAKYDCGLDIVFKSYPARDGGLAELDSAEWPDIFLALAHGSCAHISDLTTKLSKGGTIVLVALQGPGKNHCSVELLPEIFAYDTRRMAELLQLVVERMREGKEIDQAIALRAAAHMTHQLGPLTAAFE